MRTETIKQAPAMTVTDLVRGSETYRKQIEARHRDETDTALEFNTVIRQPRHRAPDPSPRHARWEI